MSQYFAKILSLKEALAKRSELIAKNQKLVFTNGCFDLLHPGHLAYLDDARSLGDFLLVGLNSDDSVKKLKGPKRPIREQRVRALMLAALVMVDAVTIFDEITPLELIEELKPDFLVKGGDWPIEDIVGGPQTLARGGQVLSLTLKPGFSTSALIEKIISTYQR
jgi:D-beta-D-heptose 7-phosphate kinase/D-beta-D-heptose 1-phosphate adenosyltransferase